MPTLISPSSLSCCLVTTSAPAPPVIVRCRPSHASAADLYRHCTHAACRLPTPASAISHRRQLPHRVWSRRLSAHTAARTDRRRLLAAVARRGRAEHIPTLPMAVARGRGCSMPPHESPCHSPEMETPSSPDALLNIS